VNEDCAQQFKERYGDNTTLRIIQTDIPVRVKVESIDEKINKKGSSSRKALYNALQDVAAHLVVEQVASASGELLFGAGTMADLELAWLHPLLRALRCCRYTGGAPARRRTMHDGTVLLLVHAWAAYCVGHGEAAAVVGGAPAVPAAAFAALDRLLAALATRDRPADAQVALQEFFFKCRCRGISISPAFGVGLCPFCCLSFVALSTSSRSRSRPSFSIFHVRSVLALALARASPRAFLC